MVKGDYNAQISDLNKAGADSIQIDAPWLSLLVDKKYREENDE